MDSTKIFYADTSYIYGGFKSRAIEFKNEKNKTKFWKLRPVGKKEESEKLQTKHIQFIISEITEFEIKHSLIKEEGLTFDEANTIFNSRIEECPIYIKLVEFKGVTLTYDFLNKALICNHDLIDALHILIASRLRLYLVTKEVPDKWKKMYPETLTPSEFQKLIEKIK